MDDSNLRVRIVRNGCDCRLRRISANVLLPAPRTILFDQIKLYISRIDFFLPISYTDELCIGAFVGDNRM